MLKKILSNFELKRSVDKFGPTVLLVLVINEECTKAIIGSRSKKNGFSIEQALILPKLDIISGEEDVASFCSSYGLSAHYCSVVIQNGSEYIRVTDVSTANLTNNPVEIETSLKELFGVDENYSLVFDVIDTHKKLATSSILAVGMDLDLVEALYNQIQVAKKRPVKLMLSSASLSTYLMDHFIDEKGAFSFLYIGDLTSTFMIFQDGKLILIRHFDNGVNNILLTIQSEFGFDEEMAYDLFINNSFDYSLCLNKFKSWFYQIGISLDYIERKNDLRITSLDLFGFGTTASIFKEVLSKAVKRTVTGVEVGELFSKFMDKDALEAVDGVEDFIVGISECINIMSGGLE
ncbi:MAG: hypothetical protein KAG98_06690 [Lentisphaeria bacterium]|nr:hypothetical protein [Lentisphaeria bacterium]